MTPTDKPGPAMLTEGEIVDAGLGQLPDKAREYLRPYVEEVVRNFRAAGLVLEQDWQPIETAPKDGRGVLVSRRPKATSASGRYHARRVWGCVCPARWIDGYWRLMLAGQYARDSDLDGWRPLPAPPTDKGGT